MSTPHQQQATSSRGLVDWPAQPNDPALCGSAAPASFFRKVCGNANTTRHPIVR